MSLHVRADACPWSSLFALLTRENDTTKVDDPATLVDLARSHGLGPMLFHQQKAHRLSWGSHFDVLEEDLKRSIFDDLYLQKAVVSLHETFVQACSDGRLKREPIALKGAHLKRTIYRDAPYIRTMGDIDILVHKEDRANMAILLRSLGYQTVPEPGPGYHRAWGHAQTWHKKTHENQVLRVDVHHRFTHLMRGGSLPADIFSETIAISGDPPLRVLGPEKLVAHLAIHLAHEFYRGPFKGLVDLYFVLNDSLARGHHGDETIFPDAARPSLAVALGLLVRWEAWKPGLEYAGVAPANGPRFERRFPSNRLFDGKKGRAEARENTLRSIFLIERPLLRVLYPLYLASVQLSRGLARLNVWRNDPVHPGAEGQ